MTSHLTRPVARSSERLNVFTPLGIRFWDVSQNRQVREGLQVTARRSSLAGRVAVASRTASDLYAFHGLAGLRELEYQEAHLRPASPPKTAFVVEVADRPAERFVPVAFEVSLPLDSPGVYLTGEPNGAGSSPPALALKGFYLFSSSTRRLPPALAVVRGELAELNRSNPLDLNRAAAHALVRVRAPDGQSWFGVADNQGRFVVAFPYPTLANVPQGSPFIPVEMPLFEQTWTIGVEVRYAPGELRQLPGTDTPDYASVLGQSVAEMWEELPLGTNPGVVSLSSSLELRYGLEAVLRTKDRSGPTIRELPKLLVSPVMTSP